MSEAAREILSRSLAHQIERLTADRDALRAELAAEREAKQSAVDAAETYREELDALRAELAAEREERDELAEDLKERRDAFVAERDALRGLLREAHVKMVENNLWRSLRARIDSALHGDGDGSETENI